ncbi:ATP-binding protein [Brachybacterium muris]|uniref:AlbA family DNA-binding domain-containing protein n=1 Tax=Brachybacterium muris TaxID=219301 RepID=UPI000DB4C953|nr:ATP-binding protein [Brachybacterium muris]MCT1999395.1 ATP-binding protein [Brachybacterium muris]PZP13219.1 MAG: hypothetical protein DI611_15175 [Brachybacterium faecium]
MQHYLGPGRPLTILDTWDKVRAASEGGLLAENQWCELKEAIGPSTKAVNTELARDIASLSVHGGILIFGVKDKTYEVVGCETDGLRDRISQVAATRISPPLVPVVLDDVHGPDGRNVLVVSVPPSQLAPHMVDERYYGRSADGKRVLSDPEVRTLILARDQRTHGFIERLKGLALNDPIDQLVEEAPTGHGHAFFLAEPCSPVPSERIDQHKLIEILLNLDYGKRGMTSLLGDCTYAGNDPDGLSLRTGHRKVRAEYEHREAQISVHDNLTITAASGGATRRIENRSREMRLVALTGTMAQFAAQFIEALREISLAQGYQGQWQVGVHLNHLRGAAGYEDFSSGSAPEFPQDSCTHHVVIQPTAWDAPQTQIEAVAVELLAKYLRGLGRSEWSFNRLLQQV